MNEGDTVDAVNARQPKVEELSTPSVGDELSEEALLWPYVTQRRPCVIRGLARGWRCCEEWSRGGDDSDGGRAPTELVRRAGQTKVRAFVSCSGNFHLDGTWNPRTVLTCSMARETTIAGLFRGLEEGSGGQAEEQGKHPSKRTRRSSDGGTERQGSSHQSNGGEDEEGESDGGCADWPSAYALDEGFHRGRGKAAAAGDESDSQEGGAAGSTATMHPLAKDVPRLPFKAGAPQLGGGAEQQQQHGGGGGGGGSDATAPPPPPLLLLHRHVATQLFLSKGRTQTQLHRDPFDNLYVVAAGGAREWKVCHPDHAPGLAPGAAATTSTSTSVSTSSGGGGGRAGQQGGIGEEDEEEDARYAISAACQPTLGAWGPRCEAAKRVRFEAVSLAAGDALFLPAAWWHSVRAAPPYSAAVNWYFSPPP